MANRFQKFIYYLSAEAPVIILLAIWSLIQKVPWVVPVILIGVALILIWVFIVFFKKANKDLSIMDINGSKFKCIDGWLIGYAVSYLLPFASLAVGAVLWIILGILLVLIMIILVFSDHVTPHPLLFFMRYHFYELEVEGMAADYRVISKKRIRNVKDIRKVSRVFEFLLIRMG